MRVPVRCGRLPRLCFSGVMLSCLPAAVVTALEAEALEPPAEVAVCQESYGARGTLRVSWARAASAKICEN